MNGRQGGLCTSEYRIALRGESEAGLKRGRAGRVEEKLDIEPFVNSSKSLDNSGDCGAGEGHLNL